MTLIEHYDAAIARGEIHDDARQRQVLITMQQTLDELHKPRYPWLYWRRKTRLTGLYLHGTVGIGKTYLMNLFYQQVNESQKARFHFHHFMQYIDTQLRRLQGQKDPLQRIAAEFSKKNRLLCFDEFLVHDVAHAMILAELLDALFARGVILVATSNIKPDDLYLNGVQRDRFLPAIALIKAHCTVIHMSDEEDYRLGGEALPGAYVYPLGLKTAQTLARQFAAITSTRDKRGVLTIQNRNIHFIRCGERAVWFDFKDICNLPRSPLDYLELTEYFDTIVVSGVPALTEKDIAQVILLIHFVDVMYDRGIRLIISAAVPLEYLYIEGEMSQTFKRTVSRLQEMQSTGYLKRTMKKLDCQI